MIKECECLNRHWSSDACLVIWEAGLRPASFHNGEFNVFFAPVLPFSCSSIETHSKVQTYSIFFEPFKNGHIQTFLNNVQTFKQFLNNVQKHELFKNVWIYSKVQKYSIWFAHAALHNSMQLKMIDFPDVYLKPMIFWISVQNQFTTA